MNIFSSSIHIKSSINSISKWLTADTAIPIMCVITPKIKLKWEMKS